MLHRTPLLEGSQDIHASTVGQINIMGLPGVIVPGGYYPNGSPFSLIFVGELFSEADLLGYAFDYEQATMHRVAPTLWIPEPNSVVLMFVAVTSLLTTRCLRRRGQYFPTPR